MNFIEHMKNSYTIEELQDIARFGCSGGVNGMIYYTETTDLYNTYCEDLHRILGDNWANADEYPEDLIESLGDVAMFKNQVVWLCAEMIARDLVLLAEEVA